MVPGIMLNNGTSSSTTVQQAEASAAPLKPVANPAAVPQTARQFDTSKTPLERTWRGDVDGRVRYEGYPKFNGDRLAERQWVKVRCGRQHLHHLD